MLHPTRRHLLLHFPHFRVEPGDALVDLGKFLLSLSNFVDDFQPAGIILDQLLFKTVLLLRLLLQLAADGLRAPAPL